MSANIIDGKATAKKIREELSEKVKELKEKHNITPGLATVLVGDDPASGYYVRSKIKACAEVGIHSEAIEIPGDADPSEGFKTIERLNSDPNIHGILVQLPLPDGWPTEKILKAINAEKDADGFHNESVGALWKGLDCFVACTPKGIMELLHRYEIPIKGKEAVVVGRSNIVGKPAAALLLAEHATVTICHSRTTNLPEVCKRADILVAAVGRAEMIKGDWIKPGAVVIDVGMNRIERDGKKKLVGDVDYNEAVEVAGSITPVPGGVGPMTIAMLLTNTFESAIKTIKN